MITTSTLLLLTLAGPPQAQAVPRQPVQPVLERALLPGDDDDFYGELWIAAGQSQMLGVNEGRDASPGGVDRLPNNVFLLDAEDHLVDWHFPFETPYGELQGSESNVTPAIAFLKTRAEAYPNRRFLMVFVVRGASGFTVQVDPQQNWAAPGSAYHMPKNLAWTLERRVSKAMKLGWTPTGMLWLQGEADVLAGPEVYANEFTLLRDHVRFVTEQPGLPFFLGGIARFEWTLFPGGDLIDGAILGLAAQDPLSWYVTTEDMVPQEDGLHYNATSSRLLGKRYAQIVDQHLGPLAGAFVQEIEVGATIGDPDPILYGQEIGLDGTNVFDSYADALAPIEHFEKLRAPNGFFYLEAIWPNGERVRWRQTTNPLTTKRDVVEDFAYLSSSPIFYGPEQFGGLCRTGATSLALSFQPGKADAFTSGVGLYRTGPVEKVLELGANNLLWTPSGVLTTGVRVTTVNPH